MTVEHSGARRIEGIARAPRPHWVGDGFRVAGYFNSIPNAAHRLDPFLMLDYAEPHEFAPSTRPGGVGVHPHRGFETVTIAFQGSVEHHDSTGAGGVIGPGDVQWMTAASGILHKEFHETEWAKKGGVFQMVQLWVNLPKAHKMDPPGYQGITASDIRTVKIEKGEVRLIAGEFEGVKGPAKTFTPMSLFELRLEAGAKVSLPLDAGWNAMLLVMDGDIALGEVSASRNDFIVFRNEGERIEFEAKKDAQLLFMAGEPIKEPIVHYGPFVMNTPRQIQEAFEDFQSGKFGHLE